MWKIPTPVNGNCVAVSTAEYAPISIGKSEITNRNVKAKFEPIYCGKTNDHTSPAYGTNYNTKSLSLGKQQLEAGVEGAQKKMQQRSVKTDVTWRR